MKKLIIKSDDYGEGYYDEQGNQLYYHRYGTCPVIHLQELGKLLNFEVENKGQMTPQESEAWG